MPIGCPFLEACTKAPIFAINGRGKRQYIHDTEKRLKLVRQARRSFLDRTIAEFSSDNDAGTNIASPTSANRRACRALRISDQIGNDVRIE